MEKPGLTYLRKLLGDAWIDAEVFSDKPTHLLGLWQKNDSYRFWVLHTEGLVKAILTSRNIVLKPEVLSTKLKSETDFVSTLAEMETTVFLADQGFAVTVEPSAPQKGPDIRADWQGVPYFVEVRTVGFSKDESRREAVTQEIFARLKSKRSSYQVHLTVGREYRHGSPKLREAVKAVLSCLDMLKESGAKEAKLYFAGKNDAVLVLPDSALNAKLESIVSRADFTAQFNHLGQELSGTPASFIEPLKHRSEPSKDHEPLKRVPEPSKDHERLRKILDAKRDQLSKGSRGIIVLEVSKLFMLSEFSIETALYGDLLVHFQGVSDPSQPVGELTQSHNNRGFLLHTSRVSAVVIQKRRVENGKIENDWYVYPTNRLNADTIRLSLEELQRFGDLEDRKHLSAENAPRPSE
jgi:hypothetical protein